MLILGCNNCQKSYEGRVEAPIIDHLRYFAPYMKKYKVVQIFPCMKIEIRRIAINFGHFIHVIEIIVSLKPKVGLNILSMSRVCHTYSFLLIMPPQFSTRYQDMCHVAIGFGLIESQSQPD